MKTLLMLAALLSLTGPAVAMEEMAVPPGLTLQKMFNVSNDRDKNVDQFHLMIDDKGAPAGVYFQAQNGRNPDNTVADTPYYFRDIERAEGVTLIESQGHKVIMLQGTLDRNTLEGRFHMKYLANGLSNQYTTCDFMLKKSARRANSWFVQNAYNGKKVPNVKIISWSLGLKNLEGICQ